MASSASPPPGGGWGLVYATNTSELTASPAISFVFISPTRPESSDLFNYGGTRFAAVRFSVELFAESPPFNNTSLSSIVIIAIILYSPSCSV